MNVLQEMIGTCSNSHLTLSEAFINNSVFLELCEGQKLWDVAWHCSQELKKLYCTGKRSSSGPCFVYIPVSKNMKFSMEDIEQWQEVLATDKVTLAVLEADSSIVFYDVSKGLAKPNIAGNVRREGKLIFPVPTYHKKKLLSEALSNESAKQRAS